MLLGPPGHTWLHTNPWGRQDALHTGWQSVPHPPKTVSGHTPRAGVPGMGGQGAIGGATYPHPGGHNTHPRWRPTLPTPTGAPPLIRKIRKDKSCFPATCAISASLPCCLEGKDWSLTSTLAWLSSDTVDFLPQITGRTSGFILDFGTFPFGWFSPLIVAFKSLGWGAFWQVILSK